MPVEAIVNKLDQAKALVGLMMNTYESKDQTLWQIQDDFYKFSRSMDLLNDLLTDSTMALSCLQSEMIARGIKEDEA